MSTVAVHPSMLSRPTAPSQADDTASPNTDLSGFNPIRPGLDLNNALVTGWDLYPAKGFLHLRRFPAEEVDYAGLMQTLESTMETLKGPLKDDRFALEDCGAYCQIVVNKASPLWSTLTGDMLKWVYEVMRCGKFNAGENVVYGDIMSLQYGARGDPPIGYFAIDNQPPPGWKGESPNLVSEWQSASEKVTIS